MLLIILQQQGQPATQISPVQIVLLAIQILVAIANVLIARRYYGLAIQNGDRTFDIQRSDTLIRHKTEYAASGQRLRKICGSAYTAALDGTGNPTFVKKANEALKGVIAEIPDLKRIIKGVPHEKEMEQCVITLEAHMSEYRRSDTTENPHETRVHICAAIKECADALQAKWTEGTNKKLNELAPKE